MAVDHQQCTAFPLFSFLPAELRLMIFEQALLPLIEPRIIELFAGISDPYFDFYFYPPDQHILSFFARHSTFLLETQSFVTSAQTLSRVCRESLAVVQAFYRRYGQLEPQIGLVSDGLIEFPLRMRLRPQGPHADIFFCPRLSLLEEPGMTPWSLAGRDMGHAKRWLVPLDSLTRDLGEMEVSWDHYLHDWQFVNHRSYIKHPLLMSPHDIIALVPASDGPSILSYNDLIIVSADVSREIAIDGLENGDRDFILKKFEQCKISLERHERERMIHHIESDESAPGRVFPDLYFAYVNPLKKRNSYQITTE